jgi:hypothetical protein
MEVEIADVVGRIWVWTMFLLVFWEAQGSATRRELVDASI